MTVMMFSRPLVVLWSFLDGNVYLRVENQLIALCVSINREPWDLAVRLPKLFLVWRFVGIMGTPS